MTLLKPLEYSGWKGGPSKAVLCLDMGRFTGVAAMFHDGTIGHDLLQFPKEKHPGESYNKFRLTLARLNRNAEGFDHIVYEEKTFAATSVQNSRVAFSFEGNLLSWAALNKIPVQGVHNGTLKKFITGKGKATKEEMVFFIEQMGFAPKDHNVADALALLTYYLETTHGQG